MADPILAADISRFVLFPIPYPKVRFSNSIYVPPYSPSWNFQLWVAYKQCVSSFWTAEEVMRYSAMDIVHWSSELDNTERSFLSMVLAFFAASDGIVAENLAQQFFGEVQIPEARCFYGFQIMMCV